MCVCVRAHVCVHVRVTLPGVYVCPSVDRGCQCDSVTAIQVVVTKLQLRFVAEIGVIQRRELEVHGLDGGI